MVVELPVDGAVVSVLHLDVPPGTYRALEAKLRAARRDDAGAAAFLAAHPDLADASVRVEGTYDGQPFAYAGAVAARLELGFDPPLSVDASPTNVTVHVSLDGWFRDATGALVDPATAAPGGANAALVADNIRRSFHAFEDRDRRGDDGRGHDGPDHEAGDDGSHEGGGDG
jgi:hypothetical protein